jgi:predicted deacylase
VSVYQTTLFSNIDFERDGKQVGRLRLPNSVTRSAYGVIPIPIAVIKNGAGPTLVLMAGNHGDEYEGQVVLGRLIRALEPDDVRGRVIILPSANLPAARAGQRVSPLDQGNLNRIFPGTPLGGPTEQIAHYIATVLMPMADCFVDLHSGGASLDYVPFVATTLIGEADHDRRAMAALKAFGGPYGHLWSPSERGVAESAVPRPDCITLGGEFGGGGVVDPAHVAYVERGVRNVMAHLGVLPGESVQPQGGMKLMTSDPDDLYTFAPDYGVFVPACALGDTVAEGQLAGEVHALEHPERPPQPVLFGASGLLICLRAIGRVEPGDCLAHLAITIDEPVI